MKQQKLSVTHCSNDIRRHFNDTFFYGTSGQFRNRVFRCVAGMSAMARVNNMHFAYPTIYDLKNSPRVRLNMASSVLFTKVSNLPYAFGRGLHLVNDVAPIRKIGLRFIELNEKTRQLPNVMDTYR